MKYNLILPEVILKYIEVTIKFAPIKIYCAESLTSILFKNIHPKVLDNFYWNNAPFSSINETQVSQQKSTI